MYPLGGGNPYESVVPVQNRKITSNTNGTYLNKLDKFAQYKRQKQEKQNRKLRIEKVLNEMHLDYQSKQTQKSELNLYDSPKLSRIPLNNYLKKSENEKLKEEIENLKTEIIELKIENHNLKTIQTKNEQFKSDLKTLLNRNIQLS